MAQDVINAEECSYVLEGSIFCFRMECPINIKFIWSDVSFTVYISLLIFCLDDLSIGITGVFNSPTITVLLLISLFMAVSISFMY